MPTTANTNRPIAGKTSFRQSRKPNALSTSLVIKQRSHIYNLASDGHITVVMFVCFAVWSFWVNMSLLCDDDILVHLLYRMEYLRQHESPL